jgi:hypothetical protein
MSYIREDFKRLKNYAKSLGLTVKVLSGEKSTDQSAQYDPYDKSIDLYEFKGKSLTFMVLCFLHELGHHREFLDRNKKDTDLLLSAMDSEKPNKAQRMALYISECNAALYMVVIHTELGLKLPKYKVEAESELDKWIAKCFWETGKHNTQETNRKKRKELREKFKNDRF